MHIAENKSKQGKKVFPSVLLRESYRDGNTVRKKTVANISHCSDQEIQAMKLALKYKDNLALIGSTEEISLKQGLSIGAIWVIYQVARFLGITQALGKDFQAKLAIWQVIARLIDQGSRLSAVRLAKFHAVCDILQISQEFNEEHLYQNLAWIADNQEKIEERLFKYRNRSKDLFLYDVTSSYLEGEDNVFGEYGYNRDGKKGKKQIVIGLLCDKDGIPVSVEVFSGNTGDMKTFSSQVQKTASRFGCERVTFVGDRGMIKSAQIEALPENFYYITAITKPQIRSLMKKGTFQLSLFDKDVCEIKDGNIRYILRRNPQRAEEIARNRKQKKEYIEKLVQNKNEYLQEHPRSKVDTATKHIESYIKKLKLGNWLHLRSEGRYLSLEIDKSALNEDSALDGCYVIKSNLPVKHASKNTIHDRYKDLSKVEKAFRTFKQDFLEVRPVFVRNEKSTKGHVFVVMLSYMIEQYLEQAWENIDITPQEGIQQLRALCSTELNYRGGSCHQIPTPSSEIDQLLQALNISLPATLPNQKVQVDTRKKVAQ